MINKTILIIDDNPNTVRLLQEYLTKYSFHIMSAKNGREALFVARHKKPDLILLDIMVPEMNGFEFMRVYHKERNTPVIILTAKLEEADKVIGLELGADDYVTKPFGMAELVARIRAVLRRVNKGLQNYEVLRIGDVVLDKSTRLVMVENRKVYLTPSEFNILNALMASEGKVLSRSDLLDKLKGDSIDAVERTIDTHIYNLRTKLESDSSNPHYILTVFGIGYRFNSMG